MQAMRLDWWRARADEASTVENTVGRIRPPMVMPDVSAGQTSAERGSEQEQNYMSAYVGVSPNARDDARYWRGRGSH